MQMHVREMETKFNGAVELLGKKGYSFAALPAYLVIGESGGGKSLAIEKSGLRWQSSVEQPTDEQSDEPRKGRGGTMGMEWWFAEEAMLIDTAGETPENEDYENDAWKRVPSRTAQEVAGDEPAQRGDDLHPCPCLLYESDKRAMLDKARRTRSRLRALRDEFGLRFPVWIMVSKADKVPGFTEFVNSVTDVLDMQRQFFGWTNSEKDLDKPFDPAAIPGKFAEIAAAMQRRRRMLLKLRRTWK